MRAQNWDVSSPLRCVFFLYLFFETLLIYIYTATTMEPPQAQAQTANEKRPKRRILHRLGLM